jgi:hypothetical protein
MTGLQLIPVFLSALLMGAHCLRYGHLWLVLLCLAFPLLLLVRRPWAARVVQGGLVVAATEWLRTTVLFVLARMEHDEPWLRLVAILGTVTLLTASSALVFWTSRQKRRYGLGQGAAT